MSHLWTIHQRAFHLSIMQLQQPTVFQFVEEVFQVYANNVLITFMDVAVCLLHGLVGIAAQLEAIAVFLNSNSKSGYINWRTACCSSRSVTVGISRRRSLPLLFPTNLCFEPHFT